MLSVWLNKQGTVHYVLESGDKVYGNLYCQQLERVNQLLFDNARLHVSVMTHMVRSQAGKCYHMRHITLTQRHLIIICLSQLSSRFEIFSSQTFNISENGSGIFFLLIHSVLRYRQQLSYIRAMALFAHSEKKSKSGGHPDFF